MADLPKNQNEQSREGKTCKVPPLVDWAEPRARKQKIEMQVLATEPPHAECLTALISHYPFIVYIGFLLWRKNTLLLRMFEDEKLYDADQPPLFSGLLDKVAEMHGSVRRAGHYGLTGNLKGFSETGLLPRIFLQQRRPLSLAHLDPMETIVERETVGNFVSWAVRNNQSDVVLTLCRELQLDLLDRWPVMEGVSTSVMLRSATRGLVTMLRAIFQFDSSRRARINSEASPGLSFPQDDLDTALYWASDWEGQEDVCQLLIENKANVNSSVTGEPPVMCAAREGRLPMMKFLLEKGAKLEDVLDDSGKPLLYVAAVNGNLEIVQFLLAQGVSAETKTPEGYSPVHGAAWTNHAECIRVLVEVGKADLWARTLDGHSPMDFADINESDNAKKMIKDLAARKPQE